MHASRCTSVSATPHQQISAFGVFASRVKLRSRSKRYHRSAIAQPRDFNAYPDETLCLFRHSFLPTRALQQAPRFRALGLRASFSSGDVCFGTASRTRGIGQPPAPRRQHSAAQRIHSHQSRIQTRTLAVSWTVGERCKLISRSVPATSQPFTSSQPPYLARGIARAHRSNGSSASPPAVSVSNITLSSQLSCLSI